jgi:hypothetical protein
VDFSRTYQLLADFLEARSLRFAVVGGVAMSAYGYVRATLDIDFAVDAAAGDEVVAFLEQEGYETLHRSRAFSNHLHPDQALGRVDLLFLYGDTADQVFGATRRLPSLAGLDLPVPSAEHLAAMKIAAMASSSDRLFVDLPDVRHLLSVPGLDREMIEHQFEKRGLGSLYRELKDRL